MKHKFEWDELRHYAIQYFRMKGGYTPPNMPLNHDWIGELPIVVSISTFYFMPYSDRVRVRCTHIKFPTVCWYCIKEINHNILSDSVLCQFWSTLEDWKECEICGKLGIETNSF